MQGQSLFVSISACWLETDDAKLDAWGKVQILGRERTTAALICGKDLNGTRTGNPVFEMNDGSGLMLCTMDGMFFGMIPTLQNIEKKLA